MASANEKLLNENIAHSIDLHGYTNNVVNRIVKLLNRTDADLMSKIQIALDKLAPSQFNIDRLTTILKSVRELNGEVYASISTELKSELKELTEYELGIQSSLLLDALPAQVPVAQVSVDQAYAAALSRPFQGKLLSEYLTGIEESRAIKIRDAIRIGYVEGQTNSEIVKRIRGTKALNYADGLLEIARRDAQSLVITAISHTANNAREQLFEANNDVIKGVRYTATLDLRTTELCASRDGNVYKLDAPHPALPAHWRCRSVYTPVLKSYRELGVDIDEISPSTRASLDGQVPSKLTYQTWLEKQSQERQIKVLGKTKAGLFRSGELKLDKFVSKQGHSYTIAELKALHPQAFN